MYILTMPQKTFNIGNSVAITIPAKAKIKAGTHVNFIEKKDNKLIYEIVEETKDIGKYIKSITGTLKWKGTPNELDEVLNYVKKHPYEKDINIPGH